jgi:hypothetical protein
MKKTESALRILIAISAITEVSSVMAELPPNLVCEAGREVQILNGGFTINEYESDVMYRFSEGSLFISSPTYDEYLYGDLTEIEYLRYTAGYKSIIFQNSEFNQATSVHFDEIETRVLQLRCIET